MADRKGRINEIGNELQSHDVGGGKGVLTVILPLLRNVVFLTLGVGFLLPAQTLARGDGPHTILPAPVATDVFTFTFMVMGQTSQSGAVTSDGIQAQQPPKATPQDDSQKGSGGDLAQQAADPTAPLMAFNFKYEYVSSFYGLPGDAHAFSFQPVIPFRAWGLSHLLRTTVSYDISGPGGSGLASVSVFDLIVFNKEWGRWGVGPLVQFTPNRGPGRDTLSAGPAIGFVAKKGKWNLGLFNQNLFGHDTRFSSVQPVVAYILGKGWSLSSGDAQWSVDWTEPQFVNIPIGVQVAKVTKLAGQPVRLFLNPEYNARNVTGAPHWSFRFGLTILAPAKE